MTGCDLSEYEEGSLRYLREKYAIGFITFEELNEGLDSVLRGGPINVPRGKPETTIQTERRG